ADRVLHRVSDLVAYASDASPYRLFPRAVVEARDADDVAKILRFGREREIPVTFRAGGTSLNGQGQSDGILVDVRKHWGGVRVEEDGARARVKPGTILGHAKRVLDPHGRKLGPDTASTHRCTVRAARARRPPPPARSSASSPTTPAGCAAASPRAPTLLCPIWPSSSPRGLRS